MTILDADRDFSNQTVSFEEVAALVKDPQPTKADFSNSSLQDFVVDGGDFYQSLFTGALIERSKFSNVQFSRSDFAATTIVDCRFEDCDFSPMGIRSTRFINCDFIRCDLSQVGMMENAFDDCRFDKCTFESSRKRSNTFDDCMFASCTWSKCSTVLNDYLRCAFDDIRFGDCTFLYCIASKCTFKSVAVNIESVGYIFGLTVEDVIDFDFIYLGDPVEVKPSPEELLQLHKDRGWYLGQALFEVMLGKKNLIHALRDYHEAVQVEFSASNRLEVDEVEFFIKFLRLMLTMDELPGVVLYEAVANFAKLRGTAEVLSDKRSRRIQDAIVQHTNAANLMWIEFLDRSCDSLFDDEEDNSSDVRMEFIFSKRPVTDFEPLLTEMFQAADVKAPDLIEKRDGSYVEYYILTILGLKALLLFLKLVNGNFKQGVELLNNIRILLGRHNQEKVSTDGRNVYLPDAATRGRAFSQYSYEMQVKITEYTAKLDIINDPTLKGFTQGNIEDIRVLRD